MAKQTINLGAAPDDDTGDSLRVGGDKINDNFDELYADKAPLNSPALTGTPAAPTAVPGTNTTQIASTAFVQAAAFAIGGREIILTADRTYYVRSNGDDANDGLTDTAGGAFLTVQKAADMIAAIDLNGFRATVQLANGTYSGAVHLPQVTGAAFQPASGYKMPLIRGDPATPSNVILTTNAFRTISAIGKVAWELDGVKFANTAANGNLISAFHGAFISLGNVEFDAVSGAFALHVNCSYGSRVECYGDLTISGGARTSLTCYAGGEIDFQVGTLTLVGAPAFSRAFAGCDLNGVIEFYYGAIVGAATGKQYDGTDGAVFRTWGTDFPGSLAGTLDNSSSYNGVMGGGDILQLTDGVAAPAAIVGKAQVFVDIADGDLKVLYGDGTLKTIITDSP